MKHIKEIAWALLLGFCFTAGWNFGKWLFASEYLPVWLALFPVIMIFVVYFAHRKFKEWITYSADK